jgi:2Fe-2S ferredoxin
MENTIQIQVQDREGQLHDLEGPTDMGMNMMELCRAAELPVEGTCGGMAMCASCHMYVESAHDLSEKSDDEEDMLDEAFFL